MGTLPRLVVAVVAVHVIHQTSEASALLAGNCTNKKKGGEISPAQFADAKLSVVLCYLPLGFVAQGLLQFLQVLRNLQWFIMSYDHLHRLIPKVQHPHSVSCHKIIFI